MSQSRPLGLAAWRGRVGPVPERFASGRGGCEVRDRVEAADDALGEPRVVAEVEDRVELRDLLAARDLGLDLDAIFDLGHYTRFAERIVGRLDAIPDLAPAAA